MNVENLLQKPINPQPLFLRALLGASIGLVLISVFLITAGEGDPEWHKLWMLRPLIIVPLAGAAGGVFHFFMNYFGSQLGWNKIIIAFVSLIVFIVGLWMGIVLGLDGTYWD